jgi:2-hydroxychromene-2-carboxylate isomerase
VESQQAQLRFQESQREAHRLGVFGVPMMIADDQMFWGNDRLDFLEEYLAATSQTKTTI